MFKDDGTVLHFTNPKVQALGSFFFFFLGGGGGGGGRVGAVRACFRTPNLPNAGMFRILDYIQVFSGVGFRGKVGRGVTDGFGV